MADVQILNAQNVPAPSTYVLPGSVEFILKAVNADFDGSGSAGSWLPAVVILSESGHVIARAADQAVVVGAGGSAEVSWFPCVKHKQAAAPAAPRCSLLGAANGTDTLTIPLTVAVPGPGVLQVVYCQATPHHIDDNASTPNGASDSNAVPGWVISTTTKPLIGEARDGFFPFQETTGEVGSVGRPCTAGDLGIGSTVTVTFTTAYPAAFVSAGLVIWQRAYWTTIQQSGLNVYGNIDSYPNDSANPRRLSWALDGGTSVTTCDLDGLMLTAMGAYPAVAGFTPYVGTKIGEIASGAVSIAAACYGAPQGTGPDPGGTWPADATLLFGNYQYAAPRTFS